MFRKKVCYTIPEFLEEKRLLEQLDQCKEMKTIERLIGHIKKNKLLYMKIVTITSFFMLTLSSAEAASGVDRAGNKIYNTIISLGYWVVLIKGSIDIIGSLLNGNTQEAKKTFFTYLLIYGTLFALPWGLRTVKDVFSSM